MMEEPISLGESSIAPSQKQKKLKRRKANASSGISSVQETPSTPSQTKAKKSKAQSSTAITPQTQTAKGDLHHNAEASSSRLPPTPSHSGHKRKHRSGRDKAAKEARRAAAEAELAGDEGSTSQIQMGPMSSKGKAPQRDNRDTSAWKSIPFAQNGASRIPHVWSSDGRFFFVVSGSSFHIHSSNHPFNRLSTLSIDRNGHTFPITSLVLHPNNAMQVITSSEDGTIKVWDWVEGRLVRTIRLEGKIGGMCLGEMDGRWWAFVTVSVQKTKSRKSNEGASHRICRVPLQQRPNDPISTQLARLSSPPTSIFISPSSTYLIVLAHNKAYAYKLVDLVEGKPLHVKFASDQILTCGAFAPKDTISGKEEWFATGDIKGVIRLWHGLGSAFRNIQAASGGGGGSGDQDRRLPTTSLHWHAHGVSAVAFTPSGSQLLSVGEESVLVQWHLSSGRREYIPRLGGRAILTLAVRMGTKSREEEWWMTMADGSTTRVGANSGKINQVGQGVKFDPLRPRSNKPYPLAVHPSTGALVLPSSHPSTLQWVEPSTASLLFDLEVSPSNRVSRRDKQIETVSVDRIAFSDIVTNRVKWMVTLESRDGDAGEGGGNIKNMKFWVWHNQKYTINTQFPKPHGSIGDITSMVFSKTPSGPGMEDGNFAEPYFLSTAEDGTAKLWQVRQAKKSEQGKVANKKPPGVEQFWSHRSTFDYRQMPIRNSAFSSDGTLIALAHDSVVSLWDTESNTLLRALSTPDVQDFRQVNFGGQASRYLVATGLKGIVVWDMLSCEVVWTTSQAVGKILLHGSTPFFTIISSSTISLNTPILQVFSPSSHNPLRQVKLSTTISEAVCLPTADPIRQLELIALTTSSELIKLGDRVYTPRFRAKGVNISDKKTTSIWQEMFGKDAFLEPLLSLESTDQVPSLRKTGSRPVDTYDGPSHTLPPVGLLFDAFMEGILADSTPTSDRLIPNSTEEHIHYELPEVDMVVDIPVAEEKPRMVTSKEINELEQFFREVLKSKPSMTTNQLRKTPSQTTLSNGTRKSLPAVNIVNGNATSSDDSDIDMTEDEIIVPSGVKVKQAIKLGSRKSSISKGGSQEDEEEDEVIVLPEKNRGQKRKARVRKA